MKNQVPIVFFSNSQERGGAEEHILTLLRGLSREYFKFHLACPPAVARALEHDLPSDVEVAEINLCKPSQLGAAAALYRLLKKTNAKILHSHLFYASFFASPVGKVAGVPVIVETPHVREQWRKGWKASYRLDRFAGRFVDHYIAVSAANKKYLVDEKQLPAEKITVILNGSDLGRFSSVCTAGQVRAEHAIANDDLLVLVPARLAPQKGHSVLIEAAPEIVRDFPCVQFVCVGDGESKDELVASAEKHGVSANFKWVGFQKNMPEWFAAADLVALPSFYEGLPLAIVEALASGRSVVATSVDGTPEIVIDGHTGSLVPAGDARELARAIIRQLKDPELRRRLGETGRRWAQEHFSDRKQIRATEQLYLALLRRRCPSIDIDLTSHTSNVESVMHS